MDWDLLEARSCALGGNQKHAGVAYSRCHFSAESGPTLVWPFHGLSGRVLEWCAETMCFFIFSTLYHFDVTFPRFERMSAGVMHWNHVFFPSFQHCRFDVTFPQFERRSAGSDALKPCIFSTCFSRLLTDITFKAMHRAAVAKEETHPQCTTSSSMLAHGNCNPMLQSRMAKRYPNTWKASPAVSLSKQLPPWRSNGRAASRSTRRQRRLEETTIASAKRKGMGYDAERATLKAEFENYLGMKSAELEYTIVADAWGLHLQDTLRVGPGFPIITCLCVCITLKE